MIGSWVREYAVQLEFDTELAGVQTLLTTTDNTAVTFGNLKVGLSGTGDGADTTSPKFKLLLNNKADLIAASAVKDTPKATGTSDKGVDDIQITVADASKFSPEMHAHSNVVGMFLSLLAQNGYSETAVTPDSTSVRIGKMIPLEEFKKALPKDCDLTEGQILKLRENQDKEAEIYFDMWLEKIKNDTRKI